VKITDLFSQIYTIGDRQQHDHKPRMSRNDTAQEHLE